MFTNAPYVADMNLADEASQTELLSDEEVRDRRLVKLNATFVLCRLIDSKQYKTIADSPIALESVQVSFISFHHRMSEIVDDVVLRK